MTPAVIRYPVTGFSCLLFTWLGLGLLWWLCAFFIRGLMVLWEDLHVEP